MFKSLQYCRSVLGGCVGFPYLRFFLSGMLAMSAVLTVPAMAAPFAYVRLGGGTGKVAIVDVATNSVVREINVGAAALAISPSGRQLYVTSLSSHTVSVVDIQSGVVTATFRPMATDGLPFGAAVHPNGSRLYVTNSVGQSLSVIDLASNLPLAQIPLINPSAIGMSPTGNFAYVVQGQRDVSPTTPRTVAVVDLQQNRVVAEMLIDAVGNETILFSPNGNRAYFIDGFNIVVVDTTMHTVVARWALAGADFGFSRVTGIALSTDGSRLYATASDSKRLHAVDTSTGAIAAGFVY